MSKEKSCLPDPFCKKHELLVFRKEEREKLAVIIKGILLQISELCKLFLGVICLIKLCESSPGTLGFVKSFLCADVSEPLQMRNEAMEDLKQT